MTDIENIDDPSQDPISDSEWTQRRLCPDGNCIGVIGPDGRCKECGRPSDDDQTAMPDVVSETTYGDAIEPEASPSDTPAAELTEDADTDHWSNRRLCSDGNCIGVIGPDGRCKECGRPYENR